MFGAFLATAAILSLTSLILARLAIRGRRVDDHPVCRKCGFDLIGLPTDSTKCSECGADLTSKNATRIGHRKPRKALLAISLLLLLPTLGGLGVGTWVIWHGTDIHPYLPIWWLLRESRTNESAPLTELTHRLKANHLSDPELLAVVDRALEIQADKSRPWTPAWWDFIAAAEDRGILPQDRWDRAWQQACEFTLTFRPEVSRKTPVLPYQIDIALPRGPGSGGRWNCTYEQKPIKLAGVDADPGGRGNFVLPFVSPPSDWVCLTMLDQLIDGPQTTAIDLDVAVHADPKVYTNHLAHIPLHLQAPWTLLPASRSTVALLHDPQLREKSAGWFAPDLAPALNDGSRGVSLVVNPSPIDQCYKVTFRSGSREMSREGILCGPHNPYDGSMGWSGGLDMATVDIILQPDLDRAAQTLNVTQIWGEEIVYKNVPVVSTTQPSPGN